MINAGVSSSEDAPFAAPDYQFLPGDYLYVTFEISGFAVKSNDSDQGRKISLTYEVTPEDSDHRPLAASVTDEIKTELSPEDKNWVPKRRASFLLPAFTAAGPFHVRVHVKDLFGSSETSRDLPFLVGGVHLTPASSITVQNLRFLRREDDVESLKVPAYSPGDTVFARFEMTGYQIGPRNQYHLAYGIRVLAPDGKPFIENPQAANLESSSFYPAQFVPGILELTIPKNSVHGEYIVELTVRDLLAGKMSETKQAFDIE